MPKFLIICQFGFILEHYSAESVRTVNIRRKLRITFICWTALHWCTVALRLFECCLVRCK